MAHIIAICNQKGGVGKTTTTVNLAASLAVAEQRILVVDLDPQANTTGGLGLPRRGNDKNTYRVLLGELSAVEAVQKSEIPFLSVLASGIDLVAAEVELVDQPQREFYLKQALAPLRADYDYIIIDCPPSLGLLTLNALVAADAVLVPVQAEYYALEGLSDLMETLERVRGDLNPELKIEGLLMTMFDARTSLSQQVESELRQHFAAQVFQVSIPRNVRLAEAPSHGRPVLAYDFYSKGAQSYLLLAQELMAAHSGGTTSTLKEVKHGAA